METRSYMLAVLGGLGLGLLLGSEFAGDAATVAGGVILAAVLAIMLLLRPGREQE